MPGSPAKPDLDQEAATFWDQYVPQLVAAGIAREIDGPQLELMCKWWAESARTHGLIANTAIDDPGYYRAVQLGIMADKQFRTLADKFGLNTKDRGQLRIKPQDQTTGIRTRKRA
jgi:phage terminase small subunit